MSHVTHLLISADITIFHPKSANFSIWRNADIDCILTHNFYFLTSLESVKIVLINLVTIVMMSAKIATPGLLKIKVFWNKAHDVMIFVHNVSNKILSRYSNYIVDVVMWTKFVNSSISMREIIITSIL